MFSSEEFPSTDTLLARGYYMRNQIDLMRAADHRSGDETAPKDGPNAVTSTLFEFQHSGSPKVEASLVSGKKYLRVLLLSALTALALLAATSVLVHG